MPIEGSAYCNRCKHSLDRHRAVKIRPELVLSGFDPVEESRAAARERLITAIDAHLTAVEEKAGRAAATGPLADDVAAFVRDRYANRYRLPCGVRGCKCHEFSILLTITGATVRGDDDAR